MVRIEPGTGNIHHGASHAESAACLHAVSLVRLGCVLAPFAQIPRQSGTWVVWVAHIWGRLVAQRHGVEREHEPGDEQAEEREKEVHDKQHRLDEEDEHAEHRYYRVEGGHAAWISILPVERQKRPGNIQLAPHYRRLDGSVVRIAIQDDAGVAVETLVRAILPELGAVCIWVGDTEKCEGADCE